MIRDLIHVATLQVVVGALLLLFGICWLRNAILRAAVAIDLLKLAAGVMVSAFGLFWFGEGIGIRWPYGEMTILALMGVLVAATSVGIKATREFFP